MAITYGSILLIDGQADRRQTITDVLRQRNWYDLMIAEAVPVALTLLRERPFDVILLDVALAQDEANQALQAIQAITPDTPLIILAAPEQLDAVSQCMSMGATDYLLSPTPPFLLRSKINSCLEKRALERQLAACLQHFNEIKQLADDLRQVVLPLGGVLAAEERLQTIYNLVVTEAMTICQADCGRLYIRRQDGLHLVSQQIDSLSLHGTIDAIVPHESLPLYDENGNANYNHPITHVAHENETLQLANLYEAADFDVADMRRFDRRLNYRSTSCLIVPLNNDDVIGVLQLVNARNSHGSTIPFSQYHRLVTESIAGQAALVLHNRLLRKRQERLLRYERELHIAHNIQSGFFPQALPQPAGWEVAARIQIAREVGGDFYDTFSLPSGKLVFLIGDVCGKGVGAAVFMALSRTLLRGLIQQFYQLHEAEARMRANVDAELPSPLHDLQGLVNAVEQTNHYITTIHQQAYMFVTLFMAILEPASGQLMFVNCGHNPPLLFHDTTVRQTLSPTGPAIGLRSEATFDVATLRLEPGDFLLAYTDGLTEARDKNGRFFTTGPLYELIETSPELPGAQAVVDRLYSLAQSHIGHGEPADDITILALHRKM